MPSIFIITRYSILSQSMAARLRASSGDFDQYRKRLFSDSRLNARHVEFKTITVPSIISQLECPAKIFFLVITSSELPCYHLAKLQETLGRIESNKNIKTILAFVSPAATSDKAEDNVFPSLTQATSENIRIQLKGADSQVFASVRLDDDDALSSSYCMNLSKYVKNELTGFPVIFPYGLQGFFSESTATIQDIRRFYRLSISPGLAFINCYSGDRGFSDKRVSVYGLGNHAKIATKNAIIYDSRWLAFFRTFGSFNDSATDGGRGGNYTKYLPHISANDMNDFKFLIQIYPKYNEILKPRIDNEDDKFSASKQVCVLRARIRARKKGTRTQRIAQSRGDREGPWRVLTAWVAWGWSRIFASKTRRGC